MWRRKWQPTPVPLPGKSHGQRSLVGYSPWVREVTFTFLTSYSSLSKRNWHSDPDKMIRWGTSLPSSRTPSFANKIVFLASKKKKNNNRLTPPPDSELSWRWVEVELGNLVSPENSLVTLTCLPDGEPQPWSWTAQTFRGGSGALVKTQALIQ